MKAYLKSENHINIHDYPKNLLEMLKNAAEYSRKSNSGIYFIAGDGSETYVPYYRLYENAGRLMKGLEESGLKPGDLLIFQIKNEQKFISLFWACIAGGIIPVPLTTSLTASKNSEWFLKLRNVCDQIKDPVIIIEKDMEGTFTNISDSNHRAGKVIIFEDIDNFQAGEDGQYFPFYQPEPKDMAFIQFSSGSTGRPKGVMLTHRNLMHSFVQMAKAGEITDEDFVASWMPLTHDMGMVGMHLTSVSVKCSQFIMSPETFIKRPLLFAEKLKKFRATIFGSPNFALSWMVEKIPDNALGKLDFSSIKRVYNGAEPISMNTAREFVERFAKCGLRSSAMFLVYGMAEACLGVTFPSVDEAEKSHRINRKAFSESNEVIYVKEDESTDFIEFADEGFPLQGMEIKILDDDDNLLDEDRIGNIVIKGPNVTQGYYNNEEINRELYTDGFLRTGDLGFVNNGRLVVTGRKKDIIFINGQNFFAHDIERICEEVEGIETGKIAACGVSNDKSGMEEMIVFIQFKKKPTDFLPLAEKVSEQVNIKTGQTITYVLPVSAIPRTTSGKIQRYKLARQYLNGEFDELLSTLMSIQSKEENKDLNADGKYNDVELGLLKIWGKVLNKRNIDINDKFFEIGGDSVKLLQVITEIQTVFNIEIGVKEFVRLGSIANIAVFICENADKAGAACHTDINTDSLQFKISPEDWEEPFPLSELQESYFVGRKSEDEYNGIPTNAYMELSCDCYDHDKFVRIMSRLIERHGMLRCAIDKDGVQRIIREIPDYPIEVFDFCAYDKEEQEKRLISVRRDMLDLRVDLENPPMLITKVSILGLHEAVIHFYVDGMIMDGWSYEVFHGELEMMYQDESIEFPPLGVSYRDYIMYKKAFKASSRYQTDKAFWLEQIDNLPEAGTLPLLRQPHELQEVVGEQIKCALSIEDWNGIEAKARKYGVTPFSVLFTSFALVIARWNYKQRFMLDIPEFDRPEFHPDVKKILGICSAFLLFVVENKERCSFIQMVRKTHLQLAELIEHHSFSGMEILREIYKRENAFNRALVPIVFGMTPDLPHIGKRLLKVRYQENHTSQIWIDINTVIYDEFIEFNWNCMKGLLDKRMICDMVEIQKDILKNAAYKDEFWENEAAISLPEYDQRIIDSSNKTLKNLDLACFGNMMEESFIRNEDRTCLITDEKSFTYKEAHLLVKAFASRLVKEGCKKGDNIVVYLDKCLEQIVSVLAITYIGAVYVPIEYNYPPKLFLSCVDNVRAAAVVISSAKKGITGDKGIKEIVPVLPELDNPVMEKPVETDEDSLISIIHTSGSTGLPKAVMIGQKGLINSIVFTNQSFDVNGEDCCIALTNLAHDMSMYDVFGMILAGGSIAIPKAESVKDPAYWLDVMKKHRITVWNSVPAMLQMLFEVAGEEDKEALKHLRLVISGGDYLHPRLAGQIKNVNQTVRLINVGGPTETTLWNIYHEVSFEDITEQAIPYGRPIDNTKYYILNEKLEQVPLGVTGMMYCAGIGVTRGYMGDPAMTAQKYIIFEQTGERIYKTGDLGRYNENGEIIFMGREDFQVKINGKRIELSGIAAVIRNIPGIINCAVKYDKETQAILAYYVADREYEEACLKEEILASLPHYMLPKYFIRLDSIPLTANGKVNWNALPRSPLVCKDNKRNMEPCNELEGNIIKICSEILEQPVYLNSDFFMMGGNSILAIRLLSRIRESYRISVTLTELFSTSSIGDWCTIIEEKLHDKEKSIQKNTGQKWIFHAVNHKNAVVNLMCFPHAGGSAMYYTPWTRCLDETVNVWPVQYPFRENRQREKLPSSLEELAYNMAVEGKELFAKPFAFFGHCTGSIIAFEVAQHVRRLYKKEPEFLIASANVSPHFSVLQSTKKLSDEEFIKVLSEYGFIDPDMFADEEFSSYFLPIIRGDFDLQEDYVCRDTTPLNCPLYVYSGTKDPSIQDYENVLDWRNFTTGVFHERRFEGGHFYLDIHRKEICAEIQKIAMKSK